MNGLRQADDDISEFLSDFSHLTEEELRELYDLTFEKENTLKQCVHGVTESLYSHLSPLFLAVLFSRIINISGLPPLLKHAFVSLSGIFVIYNNVKDERLLATVIIITGSLLLLCIIVTGSSRGATVTVIGIATILCLEFFFADAAVIRGMVMILIMKISSFAFDFDSISSTTVSSAAYLLDPASVVFGPFLSYGEYTSSCERRSLSRELLSWIGGVLWIVIGAGCAVYSSCQQEMFTVEGIAADYFTAQSFRFSHYFVCLFAQGLWWISGGFGIVTNPLAVELPRSLVDVVVVWNIPMHRYLRKYVFNRTRSFGPAIAIFATFAISSLLHGLDAQLSGVLISLGLLCYGETALRARISTRFSACVRSRPCESCNHTRKKTSPLSILCNALFSVLSLYHLIYLGMPFDGRSSATHALSVWSRHHFASHLIAVGYLILARIL